MGTFIYLLSKKQKEQGLLARIAAKMAGCSEIFWFTTSLLLFLLLGPFSAVVVAIALCNMASEKHVKNLQEPAAKTERSKELPV